MPAHLPRRCFAEFFATFCLVLLGCGAMAVDAHSGALTHVGVATVWGMIVGVMIYATGDCSGAHMNPAVTIALLATGRCGRGEAFGYIPCQVAGAVVAAAAIAAAVPPNEAALGTTMLSVPVAVGFGIEFVMSLILMVVVLGSTTGPSERAISAGAAIGGTIAVEAFVAGPLTKASMNPARSLGPAIVSGHTDHLWLYVAAPILGTLCGAAVFAILRPAYASEHADVIQGDAIQGDAPEAD